MKIKIESNVENEENLCWHNLRVVNSETGELLQGVTALELTCSGGEPAMVVLKIIDPIVDIDVDCKKDNVRIDKEVFLPTKGE